MNHRERLAALKLAALLEEFSPGELERAADALAGSAPLAAPLDKLLRSQSDGRADRAPRGRSERMRESRAVQALKERDPDRYRLLADFEAQLRGKDLLSTAGALNDLARGLGIDPGRRAKRQDVISKVMARLVELPIEAAREIVASIPDGDAPDDGYHRLATYLHKGYDPGPSSRPGDPPEDAGAPTRD